MEGNLKKKTLVDMVDQTIQHKIHGNVVIKEVISTNDYTFWGEVQSSNELKRFVFSDRFFQSSEDVKWKKLEDQATYKPQKKKPRDYDKYRNHPLVKEIDRREMRLRMQLLEADDEEEEEIEEKEDNTES
jgi:hypothetical protein